MKKLIALLLCMVMVLGLAACGQNEKPATTTEAAPATTASTEPSVPETTVPTTEPAVTEPAESVITPLLYKVTDSEGNVAWLFGSIHVGEEYFYPLPDYALDAYASSDALAVEFDIVSFQNDLNAQIEALQPMVYADGTTIVDHISEELYNDAKAALKDLGMYSSALDYYCPAMWSSFIDSAMIEKMGVDYAAGIPLPASFLVDKDGLVRYVSRPDRVGEFLDPELIFKVLNEIPEPGQVAWS
jgi:predicted small lipoprotein YifL